jgi:hypothetical protein
VLEAADANNLGVQGNIDESADNCGMTGTARNT